MKALQVRGFFFRPLPSVSAVVPICRDGDCGRSWHDASAAIRAWRKACSSVGGCRGMESRPCLPMGVGYVRGRTASRRLRLSAGQSSARS